MKTIQFTGTENQMVNLKNAMEFTDNDMPQQSETRVYVVDTHSLYSKPHWEVSQEDFMMLAENQGTVYTLQSFQDDFNIGKINETTSVIRFINVIKFD